MTMLTPAPILDIPFARKVLEHLIAHPEEHNQEHFAHRQPCGTTACIAGTAVLLDSSLNTVVSWDSQGDMHLKVEGERKPIDEHAADLLGLTAHQAYTLFYNMDNASALGHFAGYIAHAEQHQSH